MKVKTERYQPDNNVYITGKELEANRVYAKYSVTRLCGFVVTNYKIVTYISMHYGIAGWDWMPTEISDRIGSTVADSDYRFVDITGEVEITFKWSGAPDNE